MIPLELISCSDQNTSITALHCPAPPNRTSATSPDQNGPLIPADHRSISPAPAVLTLSADSISDSCGDRTIMPATGQHVGFFGRSCELFECNVLARRVGREK